MLAAQDHTLNDSMVLSRAVRHMKHTWKAALRKSRSAPFLRVPKGGFMMTVSACSLPCCLSALTSHLTKSTCTLLQRSHRLSLRL